VLDPAVSQSPRALVLTEADRCGLFGELLSAYIKGRRYSAIASWDFAFTSQFEYRPDAIGLDALMARGAFNQVVQMAVE
jgi:hypothetical protein